MVRRGAWLAVFAILPVSATAQIPPRRFTTAHWIIDQWGSDQGLPQSTVSSIAQTPDGYLWLGTYGGLVRFDGVRFTAFTSRTSPGLGSDRVVSMQVGPDSSLWIGTDRGLVRLHDGIFRELTDRDGRPRGFTQSLFVNREGVWIANSIEGVALYANGRFDRFLDRGLHPAFSGSVVGDGRGNVWAWVAETLLVHHEGSRSFERVPNPSDGLEIRSPIGADDEGRVWFRTNRGDARWDGKRFEMIKRPIGSVVASRAGGLWAGLGSGLWHAADIGAGEAIPVPVESGLDQLRTMFLDRDGTLWIGTNVRGLLHLRPRIFDVYTTADGLASDQIAAIMRDDRGVLHVGSSCAATTLITGVGRTFRTFRHPGCAFSYAETADGIIWSGSFGGLDRIFRDGSHQHLTTRDGLPNTVVLALYADPDTSVWIGTEYGLGHWSHGNKSSFGIADGLPSNEIHFVTRDRRGALWVGTAGGLARLEERGRTRFRAWTTRDGLPHSYVRAIYQDIDGFYWIGTYGGGLARFDGRHFVTISTRDGLFDDVVSSILEDASGNLWMGGNRGIYRCARRVLNAFATGDLPKVACVGYGPSDGLSTTETNGGFQPSAWQDPDGRLWFATVRGLATVDPKAAVDKGGIPHVVIEAAKVDGRDIPTTGEVTLPVGSRYLEIQYTGLTSVAPEHVAFRYRLNDLDKNWVYVNERRGAYYSGLPPGRYTFAVSAASRDGTWSGAGQQLFFTLPAPWYATLWFRTAAMLLVIGAGAGGAQLRLRRLRQQHALQQEFTRQVIARQEQERKRIAGELHDSLGQDLLVVKNRAALALRHAPNEASREQLQQISDVATDAIKSVRQIAQNLRPYQIDRLGLSTALRSAVDKLAESSTMTFSTTVDDVDGLLGPEAEINVYRIVQEALNNVVKHSEAANVEVSVARVDHTVRVEVRDDGRGFTPTGGSHLTTVGRGGSGGLGLSGMGERAQILGGTYTVESAPGGGTRVLVTVPIQTN